MSVDMNHIIISNNSYLRKGLISSLRLSNTDSLWCCIDLDYCNSLNEIYSALSTKIITSRHLVLFLGNNSIYIQLLNPLHPVRMNDSHCKVLRYFNENKGVTVELAKEFITSLKQLDRFTLRKKIYAHYWLSLTLKK